jgi:hypothetical protein
MDGADARGSAVRIPRSAQLLSVLTVAVAVLGCTPAGDESTDDRSPGGARGERAAVQPEWTKAQLPPEAMLAQARVAFDGGVLARNDETLLPHMVSGVVAAPGMPNRVRIWTSDDASDWETTDVPLRDGADAAVAASATDGRSTAVVGSTWTWDKGVRLFVLSSEDRRAWDELAPPEQAIERGVDPQAAAMTAGGALLVVGVDGDERPVAVHVGGDGDVVDLPHPGEGVRIDAFAGVAVHDDVVVALAEVAKGGGATYPVTYRSTDRGATWRMLDGPARDEAGVAGITRAGDAFVATGWVGASAGSRDPAAWSSPDGRRWTAERVPGTEWEGEQWLGAPAVWGDRVVASHDYITPEVGAVMRRDGSGRWSRHVPDRPKDWIDVQADAAVAPLADGGVLVARWARNSGIVGVVSGRPDGPCARTCAWTTALDTVGPQDPGLEWDWVAVEGETPVLQGFTTELTVDRVDERNVGWTDTVQDRRFAFTDDTGIASAPWDPPASKKLDGVVVVSDDAGGVLVAGTRFLSSEIGTDPERRADEMDPVGWFRTGAEADWTPVAGLDGPRAEALVDVSWEDDQWIAAGHDQDNADFDAHVRAAVWTSDDGVRWRRQDGPFEVSGDRDSWSNGTCRLPDDRGALVVGAAEPRPGGDPVPVAWRQTGDGWARIGGSALGDGPGWVFSCAVRDDVTVLQGEFEGRAALWRTGDGEAFERVALGERGDVFAAVRPLGTGFAAAGTRTSGATQGAVVWLSRDGERWQAVPVPSDRRLEGSDVVEWDGRLVVAATSDADPEVWILENAEEVLAASDAGS